MTKNVIELNGQKYDALTGKQLRDVSSTDSTPKVSRAKPAASGPKHLDGFSRRPASKTATPGAAKIHNQPEKSKTLMRAVVKKPAVPAKIHAKAPAAPATNKHEQTPAKPLVSAIKPGRAIRATHIPRSGLISKFGSAATAIKTELLAVKPEPVTMPVTAIKPMATTPVAKIVNHPAQTVVQVDPFQAAIEQAISHEQPKIKKSKLHHKVARKLHVSPKIVSLASFTLVALAVSGFVAYQNLPELAMRVAATRSGMHASLPSYQPSGFSMVGPIQYQPGEVTVSYKSNSDNRGFNVVQKNSSWNSETLLDNFVAATKTPYQTFQTNGRTIYIYGGNKATWVDGGIWYSIDGQSNLNSDQLLRIAGSL